MLRLYTASLCVRRGLLQLAMKRRNSAYSVCALSLFLGAISRSGCRHGGDITSEPRYRAQRLYSVLTEGKWIDPHPITCSFTKPGVSLDVVSENIDRKPQPERIRLTTPDKTVILDSLAPLRGCVQISTVLDALHFVRLRTDPDTVFCWPGSIEQEVTLYKAPGVSSAFSGSGEWAVLSPQAYSVGEFSAPKARPIKDGFTIVRWIWMDNPGDAGSTVQKWRETVLTDGSYHREILISKPAPDLPNTNWRIMGRA